MDYYKILLDFVSKKKEVVLYHNMNKMIGLGSMLSRLMVGLNLSFMHNLDFTYDISGQYCIEKFFEQKYKKNKVDYLHRLEWDFFKDTWECDNKFIHIYPLCPFEQWQHLSRHQWNILLAQLICGSPTERLKAVKAEFKERVNWNTYDMHVGVHVRCGDKLVENSFIPPNVYYKYLSKIFNEHKDKKIGMFLTSDDGDMYEIYKKLFSEFENVTILWDNLEKRYNNCNGVFVKENPQFLEQETESGCKNISLLGDCEYVVGMSSAQFTWLGGLLSGFKNTFSEINHLMINPRTHELDHWGSIFVRRW